MQASIAYSTAPTSSPLMRKPPTTTWQVCLVRGAQRGWQRGGVCQFSIFLSFYLFILTPLSSFVPHWALAMQQERKLAKEQKLLFMDLNILKVLENHGAWVGIGLPGAMGDLHQFTVLPYGRAFDLE